MYLTDFDIQNPAIRYSQKEILQLLAQFHTKANGDCPIFQEHISARLAKVGCKEDKISARHTSVALEWLKETRGFGERNRQFQNCAEKAFATFYPDSASPPAEIIHVTCTGYHSPSAAQKIVAARGWHKNTLVTHAYHMGCLAALPAIRMAQGSAYLNQGRVDIVHTEFCSLHLNATLHSDDQLVAQSLFADGLIKYSLFPKPCKSPSLRILTVQEELIPETDEKMKWECEDWGLKMTLSKEIPLFIGRAIDNFIQRLEDKTGISRTQAHYAIHPGGPKIIDMLAHKLHLTKTQLRLSEKILYNRGNISSATLPHIWHEMLRDESMAEGSYIIGLAFGPGLNIAGTVLQKCRGNT